MIGKHFSAAVERWKPVLTCGGASRRTRSIHVSKAVMFAHLTSSDDRSRACPTQYPPAHIVYLQFGPGVNNDLRACLSF